MIWMMRGVAMDIDYYVGRLLTPFWRGLRVREGLDQRLRRGDAQMWEQLPIITAAMVAERIAKTRGSNARK